MWRANLGGDFTLERARGGQHVGRMACPLDPRPFAGNLPTFSLSAAAPTSTDGSCVLFVAGHPIKVCVIILRWPCPILIAAEVWGRFFQDFADIVEWLLFDYKKQGWFFSFSWIRFLDFRGWFNTYFVLDFTLVVDVTIFSTIDFYFRCQLF